MPRQYVEGQDVVLTIDPPEGLPTAATLDVMSPSDGSTQAVPVTIDAISAEVIVGARAYQSEFSVDDGSPLPIGRPLLAISDLGESMEVWPVGRSVTTVKLARDLPFAMKQGSRFVSARCTADPVTLDAGRSYRARWRLTIGGEVITRFETFDVVPQPFFIRLLRSDLEGRYPQLSNAIASDWRKLVDGVRGDIFNDLLASKLQPDTLIDQTILTEPAVHLLANRIMTDRTPGGSSFDSAVIKSALDAYTGAMDDIKRASHLWIDYNGDGIRDDDEPQDEHTPAFPVLA